MKKIKVLRLLICLAIVYYLCMIGFTLFFFTEYADHSLWYDRRTSNIMNALFVKWLSEGIISIPALAFAFLSLNYFIKYGYFNARSCRAVKYSGWLLILSGVVSAVTFIYHSYTLPPETFLETFSYVSTQLPPVFIGVMLWIISDFIRRGEAIETENKLTI